MSVWNCLTHFHILAVHLPLATISSSWFQCLISGKGQVYTASYLPGILSVLFSSKLYVFPIILAHWELWKDFWQNCSSHILTSFMLLDIFDSCLGFSRLINLIATVASMLTEMISNNVLLIPILNEAKDAVAYDNISYSWGLQFEFEIIPPRSPQFHFNWSYIASLIRSVLHVHSLTRLCLRDSEKNHPLLLWTSAGYSFAF